jgi:hypothetical protein
MLEMDLGMSNIAGVAQITAAIALIEYALHPGSLPHLLLKEGTLLPFTGRLYGLKGGLRPDAQAPWQRF